VKADIEVLRTCFLNGPNRWTYRPVLEAWIDIGELEMCPSDRVPGLGVRLAQLLPGLVEHHCSVGARGGFLQRLARGTYAGHILEHVVLELQTQAGIDAGFGQTRQMAEDTGLYQMVFRTPDEATGMAALTEGLALLRAAWLGLPFDTAAAVARLRSRVGVPTGPGPIATRAGGPLIGIAGGDETSSIAVFAARLLGHESRPLGLLSCRSAAVRTALEHHAYASAIVESDARSIATQGLPYRRCRIGVVSSFAGLGRLDDLYIDSTARLYAVLRTQVDVVDPEGAAILNAEDPQVAAMAEHSDGAVILYGRDGIPALHGDGSNGRSVAARADGFLLRDRDRRWTIDDRCGGRMPPADRLNLSAAIAIAWAMDTPVAELERATASLMQECCISDGAAV
jgi:hypothetical protein